MVAKELPINSIDTVCARLNDKVKWFAWSDTVMA